MFICTLEEKDSEPGDSEEGRLTSPLTLPSLAVTTRSELSVDSVGKNTILSKVFFYLFVLTEFYLKTYYPGGKLLDFHSGSMSLQSPDHTG